MAGGTAARNPIDASRVLTSASGKTVSKPGDSFVVHMDREALGDLPLGHYDVTVTIETIEPDQEISWTPPGCPAPHQTGEEMAAGVQT